MKLSLRTATALLRHHSGAAWGVFDTSSAIYILHIVLSTLEPRHASARSPSHSWFAIDHNLTFHGENVNTGSRATPPLCPAAFLSRRNLRSPHRANVLPRAATYSSLACFFWGPAVSAQHTRLSLSRTHTRNISGSLGDEDGNTIISTDGHSNLGYTEEDSSVVAGSSVAAVVYAGDDGSEEMHVFFAMTWYDMESWAWGHYILEWATQGVFQVRLLLYALSSGLLPRAFGASRLAGCCRGVPQRNEAGGCFDVDLVVKCSGTTSLCW